MLKFEILLIEKLKQIQQTFKILLGVILKTQDLAGKKYKVALQRLGSHDLSHAIIILWYATK